MNLLVALLATRAFVIVSPETVNDQERTVEVNHQVRKVLRANRDLTFGILSLPGYLTKKRAAHVKPRKAARKKLDEARRAYSELDVEGAIKVLGEALAIAGKSLASSKGTPLWLSIRLELGLRLWEMDNSEGQLMVQETLGLDPSLRLPAGTQLSETMAPIVETARQQSSGKRTVRFTSTQPMLVQVATRYCVSPCEIKGLPNGPIPWRATAPGLMTQGGVLSDGDQVTLTSKAVPKRAELLERLEPLWRLPQEEADLLLADQRQAFAAPQFLWIRVGRERLSVLRGQVVPRGALFYRGETPLGDELSDAQLLGIIQSTLAESAAVGAAITPVGIFTRLGRWWSKRKPSIPALPSLPKVSMPKLSYRTLVISGATIVSTAAVAGITMMFSNRRPEGKSYDPVLGF